MALTPEQQRDLDLSEIKIRVIDNAILIKVGVGWLSFKDWPEASKHISHRIQTLYKIRAEAGHE